MARKTDKPTSPTPPVPPATSDVLMQRIVQILEAARTEVVRTVNTATVTAYWLIGRELVEATQQGEHRAAYGQALIAQLAEQLTARYGRGFSATNLASFRKFYITYTSCTYTNDTDSPAILYPVGAKSPSPCIPALSLLANSRS